MPAPANNEWKKEQLAKHFKDHPLDYYYCKCLLNKIVIGRKKVYLRDK